MKPITIWLKGIVTLYVGGDPAHGKAPVITTTLDNPQMLVDSEKNIITIVETK